MAALMAGTAWSALGAWGVFGDQSIAAVYFVGDAVGELISEPTSTHSIFEVFVALALLLGMVFGFIALRQTMARMKAQDQALAAASGALSDVIDAQFRHWGLTPAERDQAFWRSKDWTSLKSPNCAKPPLARCVRN